jgi:hypothetical protein
MATREKTIEYAWPMYTSGIADATLTSIGSITLYCPEAADSGVTFTSVTVDVGFQDIVTATGGTINELRCALTLSGASASTVTETDDLLNTGENLGGIVGPFDFTSYFNSNFGSGSSKSCQCDLYFDQSTGTTLGMRNCTAIVRMTYTYDDTDTTQIKTVRLPLESLVGTLSTTAGSEIGTNQIPVLDTVLPEDSVTIRDYFFVIEGNTGATNTTDFTVSYRIDSEANASFGVQEAALQSLVFMRWVIDRKSSIPTTNSTHSFRLWSSTARLNHVSITLHVTYEFDASTSTKVLNSILIPYNCVDPIGRTTASEETRISKQISIQEPGTITMRQSAIRHYFMAQDTVSGFAIACGSQSARTYTHVGGQVSGGYCMQQRIDSGGAQGAALTLARGFNTLTVDILVTDTTDEVTLNSGVIILNYESDVHGDGVGAHAHTVFKYMEGFNAGLVDYKQIADFAFSIPESSYYLIDAGLEFNYWISNALNGFSVLMQVQSGEGIGSGYYQVHASTYIGDAERCCHVVYISAIEFLNRYPSDPRDLCDIETARDFLLYSPTLAGYGALFFATYHSISYDIAGDISDSDGGSVTITAHRTDTGEKVGSTSRTGDGAYSITWYDNTVDVFATAYEDATHKGRSDNDVAT